MSVGEAGAAPALGRRPTEPGTVTGTPGRPWHPLPARRASPASPPGSGGPPSAGMAMPFAACARSPARLARRPGQLRATLSGRQQPAARRGPGTRASLRPNRARWVGWCGLHCSPPWWSFVKLAADYPRASKCKTRTSAPTLQWPSTASGRIRTLGLLVEPPVRLRAPAAGRRHRVHAEDSIVRAGARLQAEGPARRAQHRGSPVRVEERRGNDRRAP